MEIKDRILSETRTLFLKWGIRNVTMDDIAKELGISKKTIYQYFNNKADIVHAITLAHFQEESCHSNEILTQATDPVEEMLLILQMMSKTFKEIPLTMIYELQKYYPRSWALFKEYKNGFAMEALKRNLNWGLETGLYRKDMEIDIVAKLRVEQIDMAFDPSTFPPNEYEPSAVQMEQFKMFIHGLVTLKGKKLIYKYLNQPEDE